MRVEIPACPYRGDRLLRVIRAGDKAAGVFACAEHGECLPASNGREVWHGSDGQGPKPCEVCTLLPTPPPREQKPTRDHDRTPDNDGLCIWLGSPTGHEFAVKCGKPETTPEHVCRCPSRRRKDRGGDVRPGRCTPLSACRELVQWCGRCRHHEQASPMHQPVEW